MNDADLKALGRMHSAEEAMAAVRTASGIFERYSFDLIYARPGQTPQAWARELEEAIGHAVEHLSLYQLTIEPGTVFAALHRAGKLATPDEETGRALFDVTPGHLRQTWPAGLRDLQPCQTGGAIAA